MTIEEVRQYLDGVNGKTIKLGLEPISALMEALGWPDRGLKIIHVTGTNGKGSVCAMMSQILQCGGYKVGTFNTPYFEEPNECVCINGQKILDEKLISYMEQIEPILKGLEAKEMMPSGFEILTAIAFLYFNACKVDFVILEVGLGGRLDATNVVKKPLLAVITKIAMDHMQFLGNSLEAIASEKAGIIKPGGLVIMPKQEAKVMEVIKRQCEKQRAELVHMLPEKVDINKIDEDGIQFTYQKEAYYLSMSGTYQAYNASLAISAILLLKEKQLLEIDKTQIKEGIFKVKWPGRFEKVKVNPLCFIDGAHNVDGVAALADTLKRLPKRKTIAIVGILEDKDVNQMLSEIVDQIDYFIVTMPLNPRAMMPERLAQKIKSYDKAVYVKGEINEALSLALELGSNMQDVQIIGFGSLYMLGKLRKLILK